MPLPNDQVSAGAVADAHSLLPREADHLNRKIGFPFASKTLTNVFSELFRSLWSSVLRADVAR